MPGPNCPLHAYLGWDEATMSVVEDLVEACWPRLVWDEATTLVVEDLVEACWPRLVFCLALEVFGNGKPFLVRELVEASWPRLLH